MHSRCKQPVLFLGCGDPRNIAYDTAAISLMCSVSATAQSDDG